MGVSGRYEGTRCKPAKEHGRRVQGDRGYSSGPGGHTNRWHKGHLWEAYETYAELTCLGAWEGKKQDIEGSHAKWHGKSTNRTCKGDTRGLRKVPWSNHPYLLCRNTQLL